MDGPSLNVGDEFWVKEYDAKTRSYALELDADRSAGPLDVTPEALAEAVEQINLEAIKAAPYSIRGLDYTVNRAELPLLTTEQLNRRARGH